MTKDTAQPDTLDLDALTPKAVIVKFAGKEITIEPPRTADFLRLGVLGAKMEEVELLTDEQTDKLVADIEAQLRKMIPELPEQKLEMSHIMRLMDMFSDMAVPPDVKALEARGIKVGAGEADPKA